jgi:hypothetical protein
MRITNYELRITKKPYFVIQASYFDLFCLLLRCKHFAASSATTRKNLATISRFASFEEAVLTKTPTPFKLS